jgi:hypothetical protein
MDDLEVSSQLTVWNSYVFYHLLLPSHSGGRGSNPARSMRVLWWTKWHWYRFLDTFAIWQTCYKNTEFYQISVQRLKVTMLPLDLPCSGPLTHSGENLTTGKSHGKKKGSWQTFEKTSGYVRPERVNKWPNSMTDAWWWWWFVFRKSFEKIHYWLKSDKNDGNLVWRPIVIYETTSLNSC